MATDNGRPDPLDIEALPAVDKLEFLKACALLTQAGPATRSVLGTTELDVAGLNRADLLLGLVGGYLREQGFDTVEITSVFARFKALVALMDNLSLLGPSHIRFDEVEGLQPSRALLQAAALCPLKAASKEEGDVRFDVEALKMMADQRALAGAMTLPAH